MPFPGSSRSTWLTEAIIMFINFFVRSTFVALLLIAPLSMASPIFSIGEGGDKSWQDALNDGDVTAANDLTQAAMNFYGTQNSGNVLPVTPEVYTNNNVQGHDSLVMSWDLPQTGELAVASWDYTYGVDPDLSNARIHFSVFAPVGVWDISLELIDINGNSVGWFQSMPVHDVWQEFWIKAYSLTDQQGFEFFDGGNFDITQVVAIRLNESGILSMPFPIGPPARPDGSIPIVPAWNAWNHLRVDVPEPGTLGLFMTILVLTMSLKRTK